MFVCFCFTAWAIPLLVSQESVRGDGRAIKIDGWTFQTSSSVSETGEMLSTPGSRFINWHAALVPGTLVGSLAKDNLIPDPNYGVNLRNLIGPKFESNKEQNDLPMDPESPLRSHGGIEPNSRFLTI